MSQTPGTILLRCLVVVLTILLSFAIATRTSDPFRKTYTASTYLYFNSQMLTKLSPLELVRLQFSQDQVLQPVIAELGFHGEHDEKALAKLRSAIKPSEIREDFFIRLRVSAESPSEAANLTNAVTERVQETIVEARMQEFERELAGKKEKVRSQREKVQALWATATRIRVESGVIDLDPDEPQEIKPLDQAVLEEIRVKCSLLRATQEKISALSDDDLLKEISGNTEFGRNLDPTMSEIASTNEDLKKRIAQKRASNAPGIAPLESRVEQMETQLRKLVPVLRNRIASALKAEEAKLQSASAPPLYRPANPENLEKYRQAKGDYLTEKAALEKMEAVLKENEQNIAFPSQIASIRERAEPPAAPDPDSSILLVLYLLVGLLVGAALAFLPRPGIVSLVLLVLIVAAAYPRWAAALSL